MTDIYKLRLTTNPPAAFPRIHAIQTGMVRVKSAYHTRQGCPGLLSRLRILLDSTFTPWLPIWAWLIEHPEGDILIDTGERAAVMQPDYFQVAGWSSAWLYRHLFKFHVEEKDEIGPQLAALGRTAQRIRWVILTHLHFDHCDGLHQLPESEVLVNEMEWRHPSFSLPKLYPSWLKPTLFRFKEEPLDGFDRCYRVTTQGDVLILPTPGHTYHHSSVLFRDRSAGVCYLFAGDAVYDQAQLLTEEQAGAHVDYRSSIMTYRAIKIYAEHNPTVLLPSHDPLSGHRLRTRDVLSF
jgi:N-acyl homoserine lactone hydrolase